MRAAVWSDTRGNRRIGGKSEAQNGHCDRDHGIGHGRLRHQHCKERHTDDPVGVDDRGDYNHHDAANDHNRAADDGATDNGTTADITTDGGTGCSVQLYSADQRRQLLRAW